MNEMLSGLVDGINKESARSEYLQLLSNVILDFTVARYVGIKNISKLGFEDEYELDLLIQDMSDAVPGFIQKCIDENNESFMKHVEEVEQRIFMDVKLNVICI